jgi:hypothetical protein
MNCTPLWCLLANLDFPLLGCCCLISIPMTALTLQSSADHPHGQCTVSDNLWTLRHTCEAKKGARFTVLRRVIGTFKSPLPPPLTALLLPLQS